MTLVCAADCLARAPDLAGAVAQARVDPTLEGRDLQNALRRAIATRRGSCDWTVDHAGWVVCRPGQTIRLREVVEPVVEKAPPLPLLPEWPKLEPASSERGSNPLKWDEW